MTYVRSRLANQSAFVKEIVDLGFFTDQYWLLFPFHLIWELKRKRLQRTGLGHY